MSQSLIAKSEDVFSDIVQLLQDGKKVELRVTGDSMFPFLQHGRHVVQLMSVVFSQIKCGDIVLIRRNTGKYILHRVVMIKKKSFYIAGDAEIAAEGPIFPEQLVAILCLVRKGEKTCGPGEIKWQLYHRFYRKRSMLRKIVIRQLSLFRRILFWASKK